MEANHICKKWEGNPIHAELIIPHSKRNFCETLSPNIDLYVKSLVFTTLNQVASNSSLSWYHTLGIVLDDSHTALDLIFPRRPSEVGREFYHNSKVWKNKAQKYQISCFSMDVS